MKVWELIRFLSAQPAGHDVMVRLAGDNDIPVVDIIHAETDDDSGGNAWAVLVGDDPRRHDWEPPAAG